MNDIKRPSAQVTGRDREMLRIREVAAGRGGSARSLVIAGSRGSGKTTLLREALRDFDGDVAWYSGRQLGAAGPWPVPPHGDLLASVTSVTGAGIDQPETEAGSSADRQMTPEDLGQQLLARYQTLPARDTATVVVVDDLDASDAFVVDLVAYLVRRSHLADVSYILTCPHPAPSTMKGLETVVLSGLGAAHVQSYLSARRSLEIPAEVAATLADLTDGNPLILGEATDPLSEAQLTGDAALPLRLPVTSAVEAALAPGLADLTEDELRGLACFADERSVPGPVLQQVCSDDAVAVLVGRDLIVDGAVSHHTKSRAVAAVALRLLGYHGRGQLYRQLSAAWQPVNAVRAALYGCLSGDRDQALLTQARAALLDRRDEADLAFREELAATVIDLAGQTTTVRDCLNLIAAAERGRHLDGAIAALDRAGRIGSPNEDDLRLLTRWRGILSQITHQWALAIPSARDTAALKEVRASTAFEVLTRTARNTLMIGSLDRARAYLDQAGQRSRAATSHDRALWRLIDGQCKVAAGDDVRAATLREAVTRWCDQSSRSSWYDDVLALRALIDAEAFDEAREFLVGVESSYRDVGGHSTMFVPMTRLRYEVATFQVLDAIATIATFRSVSRGSSIHLKEIGADLIRLEAMAGLETGELGYEHARECVADRLALSEARGYRSLIDNDFRSAAALLDLVMRESPPLTTNRRWQILADLVEAHVAADNTPAAEASLRQYRLDPPDTPQGIAAQTRCEALLAPPIEMSLAFRTALQAAERASSQMHTGRVHVAYARRLSLLGSPAHAESQRADAIVIFHHSGLHGWARHAEQLHVGTSGSADHQAHIYDDLDGTQVKIVRLLLAGRRNSEVASELLVSLRTLEKMLTKLYRKFNVTRKNDMLAIIREQSGTNEGSTVGPQRP